MDWEIVNEIQEKEQQLSEVENTSLSIWENLNVQLAVRQELEKKWYTIGKLIDNIIDIAENAEKAPASEFWPDYWKKLKAVELLMEAAWYVKKKWWVEVKFSLNKLFNGNK